MDVDYSSGKILRRYVLGAMIDERVAMITTVAGSCTGPCGAASREFYHANRLGTVIAMANESGTLTAQYIYTPFGVETPVSGSANPFRYTGQRADTETGLMYYRARYYDPVAGRFLQTDPVMYADQMNLYAYVGNGPLMMTDPTGKCSQETDENGNTREVGICAKDAAAAEILNTLAADPNSAIHETNAALVEAGRLVQVRVDGQDTQGREVNGGIMEHGPGSDVATITIDDRDQVTLVRDGEEVHTLSISEVTEHELGHAMDFADGGSDYVQEMGETNAIARGNRYRERSGIPFRRRETDQANILSVIPRRR